MFVKSFVTIFLALFYVAVLMSAIVPDQEVPMSQKLLLKLLTWFIQAAIGANLIVAIYHIWY